jgi:hypothetical protein
MADQPDFIIEAYGIVTRPLEPPDDSDEADDIGDETGDDD